MRWMDEKGVQLAAIFKSAPFMLHFLFHQHEHHIKQSTELFGFRFDLCKEVLIVYQTQGILFV